MSTLRMGKSPMHYHAVPIEADTKELEMVEAAGFDRQSSFEFNAKEKSSSWKHIAYAVLFAAVLAVMGIISIAANYDVALLMKSTAAAADFDDQHRYILRNFDIAKPMSNFLPGLAGIWGVPMWAFYVNRGQGITSFGKFSKDFAISKFVTAEKAYQQTPFTGFRTFIKGKRANEASQFVHMPFFPRRAGESVDSFDRNMKIGANDMVVEEIAKDLKLKTSVQYFIAPEQSFPALVRSVTFTNLDPEYAIELEVLDGLGRIVPNGLSNNNLDSMGRTMEAWMNVYNVGAASSEGADITQPFFHISQDTGDNAQVRLIKDGYFALAFVDQNPNEKIEKDRSMHLDRTGLRTLLPFVVDPNLVYDFDTTLVNPSGFFGSSEKIDAFVRRPQGTTSRTPCAFAGATLRLFPGANVTITSVYGYAEDLQTLTDTYAPLLRQPTYTEIKRAEAAAVVRSVTQKVTTRTANPVFDAYVEQDFLDNVLRGGLPMLIGAPGQEKLFHVFSRIHGDIERDYNYFIIDTTFFSQGPGNFRDVNQNRRLDVFHSPFVGDFNLRMFLSLVQSDGFNPLTVASSVFKVPFDHIQSVLDLIQVIDDPAVKIVISSNAAGMTQTEFVQDLLRRSFRPGQFFSDCHAKKIQFGVDRDTVLNALMRFAVQDFAAKYDQNGFWVDHWTYTLDLLDNYLTIFPDKEETVLFDSEPVPFFMSPAYVRPRSQRYSAQDNPSSSKTASSSKIVRSYNAVSVWGNSDFPAEKINAMNAIFTDVNYIVDVNGAANVWQRARNRHNAVMKVSAVAKLVMLTFMKFASFDPFGFGVEMEGGKPGWNDAMNGLPGLLGSGMPEAFEVLRLLQYLSKSLSKFPNRSVSFPCEFVDIFLGKVDRALTEYEQSASSAVNKANGPILEYDTVKEIDFKYWDATNSAREAYRLAVVGSFDGDERLVSTAVLLNYVGRMMQKVESGVARALHTTSDVSSLSASTWSMRMAPTYFYFDCTNFSTTVDPNNPAASPVIAPLSFQLRTLPYFLEGPTRQLKTLTLKEDKLAVYQQVKASALYDTELRMFRISASLASMGQDVGRMKAFSPGWLENESIWLHMSYKFYLELLRGGLYDEFFAEILTGLVPFLDKDTYGRSPLEAASFIVSSSFPDARLHGVSYLARLSGSTAEFLSMWAIMMAGHSPFVTSSSASSTSPGELTLALKPVLPGWLFDAQTHAVSFTFLGHVNVTYFNPEHKNTWDIEAVRCELTLSTGTAAATPTVVKIDGAIIGGEWPDKIRDGEVAAIRVFF